MLAANYTTVRNNLKEYCDIVSEKDEEVVVTRKEEKNVVIISLDNYNELKRNENNMEYLLKLDRGLKQLSEGRGQVHELIEVDEDE